MQFDFSKLLGRIRECGYTQERLANEIRMAKSTMCLKLSNKAYFTQPEIEKIRKILGIEIGDVGVYFFTQKVQQN
jgi:transcriptional regulator with XRE-family HTH domain